MKIFKNIKRFIQNAYKWRKILANDEDFDYSYIYESLRFKINCTKNYINSKKRHLDYKQDVFWMDICINLIDKINGDDGYDDEFMNYQEIELSFVNIPDTNLHEIKSKTIKDDFDKYFDKFPLVYKMALSDLKLNSVKLCDRDRVAIMMSKIRHNKAKKLLFKIIELKLENWWD